VEARLGAGESDAPEVGEQHGVGVDVRRPRLDEHKNVERQKVVGREREALRDAPLFLPLLDLCVSARSDLTLTQILGQIDHQQEERAHAQSARQRATWPQKRRRKCGGEGAGADGIVDRSSDVLQEAYLVERRGELVQRLDQLNRLVQAALLHRPGCTVTVTFPHRNGMFGECALSAIHHHTGTDARQR
jgi:hypothetical protein